MPPYWLRLRAAQAFGNKGVVGLTPAGRLSKWCSNGPANRRTWHRPIFCVVTTSSCYASHGEAVAGPEGK
jgi:hypothetical protein